MDNIKKVVFAVAIDKFIVKEVADILLLDENSLFNDEVTDTKLNKRLKDFIGPNSIIANKFRSTNELNTVEDMDHLNNFRISLLFSKNDDIYLIYNYDDTMLTLMSGILTVRNINLLIIDKDLNIFKVNSIKDLGFYLRKSAENLISCIQNIGGNK